MLLILQIRICQWDEKAAFYFAKSSDERDIYKVFLKSSKIPDFSVWRPGDQGWRNKGMWRKETKGQDCPLPNR